eukprot:2689225-Prymnesium_polylepis.3
MRPTTQIADGIAESSGQSTNGIMVVEELFHVCFAGKVELLVKLDVADQLVGARVPFGICLQFDRIPAHLPHSLGDVDADRGVE